MSDIMQAADWSSESVFRNFYYLPSHDTMSGRAVLSSIHLRVRPETICLLNYYELDFTCIKLPLVCETEPSEI